MIFLIKEELKDTQEIKKIINSAPFRVYQGQGYQAAYPFYGKYESILNLARW